LEYFTYHLVPVLAPNCDGNFFSLAKFREVRVCYPLAEILSNLFILVYLGEGRREVRENLKGDASYKSFEIPALVTERPVSLSKNVLLTMSMYDYPATSESQLYLTLGQVCKTKS
jgi:hypothetical protein